jgi:hypothetical protein
MNSGRDRHLILFLTVCGLLVGLTLPAHAMSKAEQRKSEGAAKKAFYSSDYEKAKEIYSTLISEFDDYIYLRNIARCYEQMKQPGPALDNFKAYLKRAGSSLSEKETQEITERIAAMEKLVAEATEAESKKQAAPQAAQEISPASAAPPPTLPPPAPEANQPTAAPSPAVNSAGGLDLSGQPQPSAQPSALRPLGFALLITSGVAALVGGVLMYSTWSTYDDNKDGKCGDVTGCANARDNLNTKKLWSKISFGAAAGAAMLGGTFLYIAPSPRFSRDVAFGMGWTY